MNNHGNEENGTYQALPHNVPVAYASPVDVAQSAQRHYSTSGWASSAHTQKVLKYFTAKTFWTYSAIGDMVGARVIAPVVCGLLISSNVSRSYAFLATASVVLANICPSIATTYGAHGESLDALIYQLPARDGGPLYKMNAYSLLVFLVF